MHEAHQEEQEHLSEVYAKLEEIHGQLEERLEKVRSDAAGDIGSWRGEMSWDKSDDIHTESMADLMSVNNLIDSYSRTSSVVEEELVRNELLLRQPYFAKVTLRFLRTGRSRDVYLGSVGAADSNERQFIIDWRSPVAETYYNQGNGKMSYEVDGRTIEVELLCRRQFDIERDKLKSCFDTTVAIEDPLLLKSLSGQHSEKLQAITATIQREQNEVVRHEDVEVLLVNGIAGSGKTSVLLQRIAYLFYRQRKELDPEQVYLFTPNSVFGSYIDGVLPDMGERNPHILTWKGFLAKLGLADRSQGTDTPAANLRAFEAGMDALSIRPQDIRDLHAGSHIAIKARQIANVVAKYKRIPAGPHLVSVVADELHVKLDSRIGQLAADEAFREELLGMDVDEQVRLFGHALDASNELELAEQAKRYAEQLCAPVRDMIDEGAWLRIDRIGMRILGSNDLNAVEWLYLNSLLTGNVARRARYVMLDEVQDYTESQLMVLARYFPKAHFLLLGDENQAIREGTASFQQIRALFEQERGQVDECRLMTSYRSSPEITSLFTSLMAPDERVQTSSVQRAGVQADISEYPHADIHRNVLLSLVRKAAAEHGLTAIVTSDRGILKWIAEYLPDEVRIMHSDEALPASGVVLLDLALAKGLEFDHVIIPDAQAKNYPDTPLARRRLYTAISRATHKVTILSQGKLSPLLQQQG